MYNNEGDWFTMDTASFIWLLPVMVIAGFAFFVLLFDTIVKPANKSVLTLFSIVGVLISIALSLHQWTQIEAPQLLFSGHLYIDRYGIFFNLIFLTIALMVFFISKDYLDREEINVGEYYSLIFFSLVGMMMLSMAGDLITTFIGIEVMSISVYILVAFNRSNYRCIEGALKYLVLGAFASGFLLYGISLIYGETGFTSLDKIQSYINSNSIDKTSILPIGVALLLVGFAFKVALVPFHSWAPDVYEGASTPVTALMSTAVKAAAFSALVRTYIPFSNIASIKLIIWLLACVTIVWGNIAAVKQTNLKRMLAYSGIAHSGYLMAGLLAIDPSFVSESVTGILFYLASYLFMNLGIFALMILLGKQNQEPLEAEDWSGFGFHHPWIAVFMSLFMLSLGGLPPTAGFFAKFYLFTSIFNAGYQGLVVIAFLSSAISFYYYLKIVVSMYMKPLGDDPLTPAKSLLPWLAVGISASAAISLGLFPSGTFASLYFWANEAVKSLL